MSQADLCRRLDDLAAKFRQGAGYYVELFALDPESPFAAERHKSGVFLELAAQQVKQAVSSLRAATTDAAETAAMKALRSMAAEWQRHQGQVDNHRECIALAGSRVRTRWRHGLADRR